jgi:hypothetical protein
LTIPYDHLVIGVLEITRPIGSFPILTTAQSTAGITQIAASRRSEVFPSIA